MFHSDSAFATLTSQALTHEQKLMNLAKERKMPSTCWTSAPHPPFL